MHDRAALLIGGSLELTITSLLGDAIGILSAVFYAGYVMSASHLRLRLPTSIVATYSSVFACVFLLMTTLISQESFVPETIQGWFVLVSISVISQVFGQSLITYAFAHITAYISSLCLLLEPVIATFIAWLVFSEILTQWQIGGGAMVLIGISLSLKDKSQPAS